MKIRNIIFSVLFSPIVLFANQALANSFYVQGNVLVVQNNDGDFIDSGTPGKQSYEGGFGASINIGTRVNNNFRVDVELGYAESDIDKVNGISATGNSQVEETIGLVNAYYDYILSKNITIYGGLGVGVANIYDSDFDESDVVFAYKTAAGLSFRINKSVDIIVAYNYLGASSTDYGNDSELDHSSHRLKTGIRLNF